MNRPAAIVSLFLHVVLAVWLALMPPIQPRKRIVTPARQVTVTHLVYPKTELTQVAPNRNKKLSKELAVEAIVPAPAPPKPAPVPVSKPAQTAKLLPPPKPTPAKVEAIDPPKLDPAKTIASAPPPSLPTPPPPTVEAPKLTFEAPTPVAPVAKVPNKALVSTNPVQDALRNLSRGDTSGGLRIEDTSGPRLPASPGRPRADLELKSDPEGVDFKPYLIRVLATVRQNWYAVYPEAARLGLRGQVLAEFAIAKSGTITKIVLSSESGSKVLDQAAVAALSASNPLPPLPLDFKGARVVLQFTFSYNIPNK